MARSVSHRLRCEHLEERAVPADVGCTAAAESAASNGGEVVVADGNAFAGELPDDAGGVLGAYRVQVDENGTVVLADAERPADQSVVDAREQPAAVLSRATVEFNFADKIIHDLRFDLNEKPAEKPMMVHAETHPAGRRITEGELTWGVDDLLTVDPVDVVKMVMGLMGETCQAA
ncbi:MAG TPA: hypothetical protein VKD71_12105 [Gemmataceae bacterium]|nr:hypothetical protein [Gemmataceae bacterium]